MRVPNRNFFMVNDVKENLLLLLICRNIIYFLCLAICIPLGVCLLVPLEFTSDNLQLHFNTTHLRKTQG